MTIRFATVEDIPALVEGGRSMHALTRFRDQPYNEEKVAKAFNKLILRGHGKYVYLVAEDAKDNIVGALIGLVEQQIFSDCFTASIMHYDVLPEARMGGYAVRLLKAFEQWAKNRKAIEINFGINSGTEYETIGRFAQRMGYAKVGENYVLGLT
jgi:GNAT superfamily N-acetyltransferase